MKCPHYGDLPPIFGSFPAAPREWHLLTGSFHSVMIQAKNKYHIIINTDPSDADTMVADVTSKC